MLLAPLLARLAEGYTIITPTQRLAREILYAFSLKNNHVSIKPMCFSYESWLQKWYQVLQWQQTTVDYPCLLTSFQLERLWQFLSPAPLNQHEGQLQLSTLRNCSLARQQPIGSDFLYTPQAETFSQQWQKLNYYLKHHDLLAPFQLADFLNTQDYPLQTRGIIWAFFDCFHPEQQAIQAHLDKQGIAQDFFELLGQDLQHKHHYIFSADTMAEEHQQIIAWTKAQMQAGHQRIGIILPDLANHQDKLKLQFKSHFPEELIHFSLGKTLNYYPLVRHALSFLRLNPQLNIEKKHYTTLLLSPFIEGYQQEKLARIEVLKHPLLQEPMLYLKDLIHLFQQYCPILAACLAKITNYPKQQSPDAWVSSIALRLEALGFPGNTSLTGPNLQALNQLYACIEHLHEASLIDEYWQEETAFLVLTNLIQKEIIQPPQNHEGIHIMGWLESSGFIGDTLWIGHLDSQNLPQAIKYSPYLPIHWQKQHKLPRTSREAEFDIANNMLQRLIIAHQEKSLVLSYAKTNEDGEPLWPSVLLPNWPGYSQLALEEPQVQLETLAEEYLLPLAEGQILKGGSQLLSAQAKCPFWAFAQFRLKHQDKSETTYSFNPLERGNLIHRALQKIWQHLGNQATLLSLSEQEEQILIEDIALQSLNEFTHHRPYTVDKILYNLEHRQLCQMIKNALALDKTRAPFSIAGTEERIQLTIDNWPFDLRFDRLDRLENGQTMVIDYKSSLPSSSPWNQERPQNPQLLMYALAQHDIRALVYFAINPKQAEYKGISAESCNTQGIQTLKQDWSETRNNWHKQIEDLLDEIRQGQIAATPENESLCTRCVHRDICRKEYTPQDEA